MPGRWCVCPSNTKKDVNSATPSVMKLCMDFCGDPSWVLSCVKSLVLTSNLEQW